MNPQGCGFGALEKPDTYGVTTSLYPIFRCFAPLYIPDLVGVLLLYIEDNRVTYVLIFLTPDRLSCDGYFFTGVFFMSARYISYDAQGRPTREEAMTAIIESYINITKSIKQLENIFKREQNYRRKKFKNTNITK